MKKVTLIFPAYQNMTHLYIQRRFESDQSLEVYITFIWIVVKWMSFSFIAAVIATDEMAPQFHRNNLGRRHTGRTLCMNRRDKTIEPLSSFLCICNIHRSCGLVLMGCKDAWREGSARIVFPAALLVFQMQPSRSTPHFTKNWEAQDRLKHYQRDVIFDTQREDKNSEH